MFTETLCQLPMALFYWGHDKWRKVVWQQLYKYSNRFIFNRISNLISQILKLLSHNYSQTTHLLTGMMKLLLIPLSCPYLTYQLKFHIKILYTYTYIYIYIYAFMCKYLCVCVYIILTNYCMNIIFIINLFIQYLFNILSFVYRKIIQITSMPVIGIYFLTYIDTYIHSYMHTHIYFLPCEKIFSCIFIQVILNLLF